ncbi:integrase core domain-containing protein [Devosia indica]
MLDETLFPSPSYAKAAVAGWRMNYNANQPHSRLGWMTPSEYANTFNSSETCRCAQLLAPHGPLSLTQAKSANATARVYITLHRDRGNVSGRRSPPTINYFVPRYSFRPQIPEQRTGHPGMLSPARCLVLCYSKSLPTPDT